MKQGLNQSGEFTQSSKANFIHLRGMLFAEYNIIYRVNDCYSIKDLSEVALKHQLLFQKFENETQQMNLVLVDSIFPTILSDLAIEVLTKRISLLKEYINLERKFILFCEGQDQQYYKYKFQTFIHYLAFSNINGVEVCKGEIYMDKVYYKKNNQQEIDYYPIYRLKELQNILLEEMLVRIDFSKSQIRNKEATICLQIFV